MYQFDLSIESRIIVGISAMVLLFTGFLISFITSQRKKIQHHKELELLHEQQQQLLVEQNNQLEQRVKDRTAELRQQKEALQVSLADLKTTQMQLIQKEKLASLGELTAGIAHEIQNPLNFVKNFSEISVELIEELKQEVREGNDVNTLELAETLSQNLEKIGSHSNRASRIVKGMLEHSRLSSGERRPTDLNALLDEYMRLAYHGLRAKDKEFNCELVTSLDPQLVKLTIIPQDIGRVLLNLLNNAFYAVREKKKYANSTYKPTVTASTNQIGNKVEIRILDNGIGIPDSIKAKIFQPFFTTKPTGEGTGLGLSLSYDIITKSHNGGLEMETKAGEFTGFVITLPIS
ncbi:sensor histidine kinase [Spirosoma fluviale]|uniref:histidine kinase n=1 Tax=Spirosoma fluviale TaxID=1597977 RepID=A0A286GQR5_9BACT|nr:ATP-binding protein [Spirosoma fluviale]SOD97860.1 His Kinase A (phospho-acceptor) domain-containing protein [Spirosoma fluviale]